MNKGDPLSSSRTLAGANQACNARRPQSAPGVDEQTVPQAKENFEAWIEPMLDSLYRQGYKAPAIRRVYIPKPGKQEKRPSCSITRTCAVGSIFSSHPFFISNHSPSEGGH